MEKLTKTIGFIGAGNMARAILNGILKAGLVEASQTMVSDISPEQLEQIKNQTQARTTLSNAEVVEASQVIVFATKPFHMGEICEKLRPVASPEKLFISICAGIPTHFIEEKLGAGVRVIRVMPNTPALIGSAATGIAPGTNATPEDLELAKRLFDAIGKSVVLGEDKLDLVTGLSGSGPAYVFYFMEGLIDAATRLGLSPEDAQTLTLQTVYGAARMALESGRPLHELRQAVTTKGGTTEAGLKQLAEGDLFELLHQCVAKASERSRELAQGK